MNKIFSINKNKERKELMYNNFVDLCTDEDFKNILENRDTNALAKIIMSELYKALKDFKSASDDKSSVDAISIFSNSIDLILLKLMSSVQDKECDEIELDDDIEDLFKNNFF